MKKILTLALSLVMCLSVLVVPAHAKKQQVVLHATVRDFKADGVLFEGSISSNTGLVQDKLGSDHKPIYNLSKWQELYGGSVAQENLNALFNDVPNVNMRTKKTLTLDADSEGYYVIDSAVDEMNGASDGYFPIDNDLFGNEGNSHNYHFSTELHAVFQYKPGDTFEFTGDDDLWAFFNGVLCVDLGGVHGRQSGSANIDDLVAEGKLNIKPGDYVNFDLFYMERHTTESNMYVKTNIDFVNFDNSDWAKDSVYFMVANGVIAGIGDNRFAPKNTTSEEEAAGFANASREQAIVISVRSFKNLK